MLHRLSAALAGRSCARTYCSRGTSPITSSLRDGILTLSFDDADAKVNTLTERLLEQLNEEVTNVESGATDARAVVMISRKASGFVAGADIKIFSKLSDDAQERQAVFAQVQGLFDRIEASRVPWVAAIHGATLGGGLELALAAKARVCVDAPSTMMGLPEVKLGLLPGAGGTQRMPALVGLQASLEYIVAGKNIRPAKAKSLGLVDVLVDDAGQLEATAVEMAEKLAGGGSYPRSTKPGGLTTFLLEGNSIGRCHAMLCYARLLCYAMACYAMLGNPIGRWLLFKKAREATEKATRGLYPAPGAIIDCIEASDSIA